MISDIVERAHSFVALSAQTMPLTPADTLIVEMADEIERLRAKPCPRCNDTGNARYWEGRWRDTHAENQKLLDEIERLRHDIDQYMAAANSEATEVERLRAGVLWHCAACGTVTHDDSCDCTRTGTGTQRLVRFDPKPMSDEIERLQADGIRLRAQRYELADEIERLRAENRECHAEIAQHQECHAEIERLRAALKLADAALMRLQP
jgi:hypothetical protein